MSAIISDDQRYRYRLSRQIVEQQVLSGCAVRATVQQRYADRTACFIMLNPSTADAVNNDPTIRRCIGFAHQFECGRLDVVNLFALRATDPKELYTAGEDAIGIENNQHIIAACVGASIVICAWGNNGNFLGRSDAVKRLLQRNAVKLHALKINASSGQPSHPLYLKSDSQLIEMPDAASGEKSNGS